ncbi:MAG: HEAT repeat domain-containing protein [Thermodesulfobacteriota bacterium]
MERPKTALAPLIVLVCLLSVVCAHADDTVELVNNLKNDDPAVRIRAIKALGGTRDPRAFDPIRTMLYDKDPGVRRVATHVLAVGGDRRALGALVEVLQDKYAGDQRVNTAYALRYIKGSGAVDALVSVLKDENPELGRMAANTLGFIGDRRALGPLLEVLKDESSGGPRAGAAFAIGRIGGREALEPLLAALKDRDPAVRLSASQALGNIGGKNAIEPLIDALKDEDPGVRMGVSLALTGMTGLDMGEDHGIWRTWWEDNKDRF